MIWREVIALDLEGDYRSLFEWRLKKFIRRDLEKFEKERRAANGQVGVLPVSLLSACHCDSITGFRWLRSACKSSQRCHVAKARSVESNPDTGWPPWELQTDGETGAATCIVSSYRSCIRLTAAVR